jgi:hypothetical protein
MDDDEAEPVNAREGARPSPGLANTDPTSAAARWGIGIRPWLWWVRIRILFVIDGRITQGSEPDEFGLGLVLDTLRDPWFAWWLRIEVTVADRDEQFRFTQDGFNIDDYDQVWFFGDWPGLRANDPTVGDNVIGDDQYGPLDDAELLIVASWMDRGGGVFATGDHALLGASMCHRIPRVRTMRRWTRAQHVPTFAGDERNETLVHGPGYEDLWEGDRWPQRIYPVLRPDTNGLIAFRQSPHPILCGTVGVIEHFPDHMHEGGLFEDDEVRLDDPLDIPGYTRQEYPVVEPVVAAVASDAAAALGPAVFGIRPRPRVVAHGLTTHLAAPRSFPMVGTYDGDPVGLGRVVVDSTWHHWFSLNLVGLRDLSPGYYAGMQDYYRNVALWLATPEQRASMLFAATWGAVAGSQPGAFDPVLGIRRLGERVVDVIGRTAPQCILDELVATVAMLPNPVPRKSVDDRSWIWAPSSTTLNTLIVGGIAIRMLDQAHHHINEQAHGRDSRLDADAVRRLGLEGVAAGKQELLEALAEGSERFAVMRDLLEGQRNAASSDIPNDRTD